MPDGIEKETFMGYPNKDKLATLFDYAKSTHASTDAIRNEIMAINQELTKLKIKAGIWGLMGGAIPISITIGIILIKRL